MQGTQLSRRFLCRGRIRLPHEDPAPVDLQLMFRVERGPGAQATTPQLVIVDVVGHRVEPGEALGGGPRCRRFALEERDLGAGLGKMEADRGADDPPADDSYARLCLPGYRNARQRQCRCAGQMLEKSAPLHFAHSSLVMLLPMEQSIQPVPTVRTRPTYGHRERTVSTVATACEVDTSDADHRVLCDFRHGAVMPITT